MEIYLLRHGIALARGDEAYPNDDRPLTEDGIKKMKKEAKGIKHIVPQFDAILTSSLIRTHDTAHIVAAAFQPPPILEKKEELFPGFSIKKILALLDSYQDKKRILLVGHEPDLSSLASELIGCSTSVIEFKKGSLCRIDTRSLPSKRSGKLIWHLAPKQLRYFAEVK